MFAQHSGPLATAALAEPAATKPSVAEPTSAVAVGVAAASHQILALAAADHSTLAGEPEPARSMVTTLNSVGAVRSKCYLGWSSENFR